jgi:hypothetical protein
MRDYFAFISAPQGVHASALCRDVAWLTEELLFRNKDVGFGGSLPEVVCYALALLGPHLTIISTASRLSLCVLSLVERFFGFYWLRPIRTRYD